MAGEDSDWFSRVFLVSDSKRISLKSNFRKRMDSLGRCDSFILQFSEKYSTSCFLFSIDISKSLPRHEADGVLIAAVEAYLVTLVEAAVAVCLRGGGGVRWSGRADDALRILFVLRYTDQPGRASRARGDGL